MERFVYLRTSIIIIIVFSAVILFAYAHFHQNLVHISVSSVGSKFLDKIVLRLVMVHKSGLNMRREKKGKQLEMARGTCRNIK